MSVVVERSPISAHNAVRPIGRYTYNVAFHAQNHVKIGEAGEASNEMRTAKIKNISALHANAPIRLRRIDATDGGG